MAVANKYEIDTEDWYKQEYLNAVKKLTIFEVGLEDLLLAAAGNKTTIACIERKYNRYKEKVDACKQQWTKVVSAQKETG